jgi:fibronectin type 3 domain-containing protein
MPLPRAPWPLLHRGLIATLFLLTLCVHAADDVTSKSSSSNIEHVVFVPAISSVTTAGVGIASRRHRVDLSWNASAAQNVIGYNIYRGKRSRGPYRKINPVLNASTVYTDTSVFDGNTYYYVTTAVDSDDKESAYSNQARVRIP